MKIAIIGAGISGLTAAYYLNKEHDICVYESAPIIGGHTATIDVESHGQHYAVDTGFIVYNDWTYPNFIRLLDELNVETQATSMSFSVSCEDSGLEYAGSNLNTLFAQRKNLFSLSFWKILKDIMRFNREAIIDLDDANIDEAMTLREYLEANHYSDAFKDNYLVPMGAAIWSAGVDSMLDFPLLFFVRFFKNHGLLSVTNRPQWRVIKGGSRQYLAPLTSSFLHCIKANSKISDIQRDADQVWITTADGQREAYDYLVMATHSDQALDLLGQPSNDESDILGAIPYQNNEVVLHTDITRLPANRRAWACWNYRLSSATSGDGQDQGAMSRLTYDMNLLQGIESPETFCVSLNQTDTIAPETILGRYNYSHPVFTLPGMQAQSQWETLAGQNRTWFCGAYWANGFHEDGVRSALRVVNSIADKTSSDNAPTILD
ncbi:MAG: FAD-dependent oxidoreductase [Cellvibrionales bacterium]|nr:FAD-dependent oxidoreductase [Cellvibrionales bacterium]